MKTATILFITAGILTLIGCEETSTSMEYQKDVVVNGTLTAGESIDTLRLRWTGRVDSYYDPAALAIPNAAVVVRGVDVSFYDSLVYDAANPGRYHSMTPLNTITPGKTYSLSVDVPGWHHISATTTVPDTFSIVSATVQNGDTLIYDPSTPVNKFFWSSSRLQASYYPTITYLDDHAPLIPKAFYDDTTSADFQYPGKVDYRTGLPSDQLNTDLPWVFLTYYGNVRFDIYAVDFNYNDYVNQIIPAEGGELRDIRFTVNGGIGVFGSRTLASGSLSVYLAPKR